MVEEFDRVAIAVLAPDIQKTLNVSTPCSSASPASAVSRSCWVPYRWHGSPIDSSAFRIVGFASIFWGLAVILQGLAVNPFQMFCARALTGLGQSNHLPVHSALLADNYPVQARGPRVRVRRNGASARSLGGPVPRRIHR
jgi:MFS family permease